MELKLGKDSWLFPLQIPHGHGCKHGRELHYGRRSVQRRVEERNHPPLLRDALRREERQNLQRRRWEVRAFDA